jgi:hypothetical protein
MVVRAPVRGPDFVNQVRLAESVVQKAETAEWDFGKVPELFARDSRADVIAKELAVIHDGHRQTLMGHLVMAGIGTRFNLMGPLQPDAEFKIKPNTLISDLNTLFGSAELTEFLAKSRYGRPVNVEYFNHTMFYSLRDLIFWHVLHGSGGFPSSLEHMKRHFTSGKIVQNNVYEMPLTSREPDKLAVMQAHHLMATHETPVVEWMEKPLYGGLEENTFHVEYLLTPAHSTASHPYLPIVDEGRLEFSGVRWHVRKFVGVTPKEGLRGPQVPPESTAG